MNKRKAVKLTMFKSVRAFLNENTDTLAGTGRDILSTYRTQLNTNIGRIKTTLLTTEAPTIGVTATKTEAKINLANATSSVATAVYAPSAAYAFAKADVPVGAPRLRDVPSPKSTVTLEMGIVGFDGKTSVKEPGTPAITELGQVNDEIVGRLRPTLTAAEPVPR